MAKIKEIVWNIAPHTKAKHEILENYLKAWFPILSKYDGNIIYLDGFAGPGEYSKGEAGSPVIAINTAINHSQRNRFNKIFFFFIELDRKRAENLRSIISTKFPNLPTKMKCKIIDAEFAETLENLFDELEDKGSKLAPTFAFVDPFGFAGFPMRVITRLLSYKKVEVFITFMSGFITRFIKSNKSNVLTELYGDDDWKQVNSVTSKERDHFLVDLYMQKLQDYAQVNFTRSFEIRNDRNHVVYHLVYATNNLKGLEVMKDAMIKVDKRGTYKFSDRTDPNQVYLIDYDDKVWIPSAAQMVHAKFKGLTVKERDVYAFVLSQTPHRYLKEILKYMEKFNPPKITEVKYRSRKFSYPSNCLIAFSP